MLVSFGAQAEISLPIIPTKKKKSSELPTPPQAIPVAVRLEPGGTVSIPLRVYGRRGKRIQYLLRREPKLGKIVGMKPDDLDAWTLTYRHTAPLGEGKLTDQIVFVAQDDDGTSAPAEITITVVDAPPELVAPESLDFGETAIGTPVTRTITLANHGGGVAEGALSIDPPWRIEPANYRLGRGEEARFQVTLEAGQEQEYRGRLRIPNRPKKDLILRAVAFSPVIVEPLVLDLVGSATDLGRSGSLTLTNKTDTEQTVTIEASPRLNLPKTVTLAARESRGLEVVIGKEDLAEIETKIEFRFGSALRPVQVHSLAVGPRLRAKPETVEFGKVAVGQSHTARFHLENWGGSSASVVTYAPPPFQVNPDRFELEAGKGRDLTITFDPAWQGPISDSVKIQTAGSLIELPVTAEVVPRTAKTAAPAQTGTPETASPSPATPKGSPADEAYSEIPAIGKIETLRMTSTSISLAWPPPLEDKAAASELDYRVEARSLTFDASHALQTRWVPMPNVTLTKTPDLITATVTGIPAGASATVQVVSVQPDGAVSKPSSPLHFSLPPPPVIFTFQRLLLAFFALLLAGALWLRSGRSLFGVRFGTGG